MNPTEETLRKFNAELRAMGLDPARADRYIVDDSQLTITAATGSTCATWDHSVSAANYAGLDPTQYPEADRLEVDPPIEVESAMWSAGGTLDWWVRERQEWLGRVRGSDGRQKWIKAADLRRGP